MDDRVELLPEDRISDLEYPCDTALHSNDVQTIHSALDSMVIEIFRRGICFAPSECKIPPVDRQEPVPALALFGDELEEVDRITYLGSPVTPGGDVVKARAAFANLRDLWPHHDLRLSFKCTVYSLTVPNALLYGSKI